jgi:tellurite resistance protein
MQYTKKILLPACLAMMIIISCSDSKMSAEEQARINTMDSTSKAVEQRKNELEEQTRKVEESLEQLDEEFTDSTTKKD